MAGLSGDLSGDPVEVVVTFLNTLDERTFAHRGVRHEPHDDLTSATALGKWFGDQGLAESERPRATGADLADALALRAALRDSLTAAVSAEEGTGAAWQVGYPLRLVAGGSGELALVCDPPRGGAAGQALATLVTVAATAAVRGTWERVRVCAAPECRWAFFDASRRGDKRWCSTAVCGNRHKTAEYRARASHPDA